MTDAFRTLQDWIDVESITGNEAGYADVLARHLEGLGFGVERQELEPGRCNLLARGAGAPEVVFCTHLDTVPPFFGPSAERGLVRGRGACDAKGPALAMLLAAEALLDSGEDRVGFLFTVGEETDSAGAALANERLADPWRPRFTIIGEPTGNRFCSGHKGIYKAELCAHGTAGHSSQDVGPSAVHELVACLTRLLAQDWGEHPVLGRGTLNVGRVRGGVAANVVADEAWAELLLRAVEDPATTEAKLRACLTQQVELDAPYKAYGPVEFHVPAGEEGLPVAFGTDAPHMPRWGTPLLYGPGRILDAHTDHECLERASFDRAVADYERVARELLQRSEVKP